MRCAAAALAFALALAGAGCAALVPAPVGLPASSAPPASLARAGTAPAEAARDSSPTPEAIAVLATIPEPLGDAPPLAHQPAPPEAFDSLRAEAPARDVPVPAPTQPLRAPAPLPATPLPAASTPAPPPPANVLPASPAPLAPAAPDTCWRVQVAAPADRAKAKSLRDAAESLLMVPMVADREGGRFKVRSRDCLSREAAESLKARATDSGFKGVFLVRLPGAR